MIKVLIKRRIKDGKKDEYNNALSDVKSDLKECPGFVSGEVMVSLEDSLSILVVATWQSQKDWLSWLESGARAKLIDRLEGILESHEEVECYLPQT